MPANRIPQLPKQATSSRRSHVKYIATANTSIVRCLGIALALTSTISLANQTTQKDIEQMRDSLVANFDAQSREDVDAMIATISPKGQ